MGISSDGGVNVEERKIIFKNVLDFLIAPTKYGTKVLVDATPKVSNIHFLLPQAVANTITNLIGGAQYQELAILGDGVVVINNNANIKTNTGANKTLLVNKVYTFFCIDNIWYEHA